mmetsp:Transcript_51478/g.143929  ORF Transcript_51478/g.143929 Transcript_51478/m.143929 type:complete len:154 (+) Transcript_51478:206-667(+)
MACARRCHLLRNTSTNFRRFVPGNFCDCSRSDYCICKCSDRRTIFDNLADRHGSRPKRGIDLETMEFDKLQELLTIVRERKGGITEEDLENATSFLMADLGGAHKFTWFQFEKWYLSNYENEILAEEESKALEDAAREQQRLMEEQNSKKKKK